MSFYKQGSEPFNEQVSKRTFEQALAQNLIHPAAQAASKHSILFT